MRRYVKRELRTLRPLLRQGLGLLASAELYQLCGRQMDMAMLMVYLSRLYHEISYQEDLADMLSEDVRRIVIRDSPGPVELLGRPQELYQLLQILGGRLAEISTVVVARRKGSEVQRSSLAEGRCEAAPAGSEEEPVRPLTEHQRISQASKVLINELHEEWLNPAYQALRREGKEISEQNVMDYVLLRIQPGTLVRLDRFMTPGPVRLWRRFFELRAEPVPLERAELLREEDQERNRQRREGSSQ